MIVNYSKWTSYEISVVCSPVLKDPLYRGDRPHHQPVVKHGTGWDDGIQLVHMVFVPPIVILVLYFELYDKAETW